MQAFPVVTFKILALRSFELLFGFICVLCGSILGSCIGAICCYCEIATLPSVVRNDGI